MCKTQLEKATKRILKLLGMRDCDCFAPSAENLHIRNLTLNILDFGSSWATTGNISLSQYVTFLLSYTLQKYERKNYREGLTNI